jgi:hypothetical protein
MAKSGMARVQQVPLRDAGSAAAKSSQMPIGGIGLLFSPGLGRSRRFSCKPLERPVRED